MGKFIKILLLTFFICSCALAQTDQEGVEEDIDRWDNWLIIGNKVVFGGQTNIKHSHELQWRVDNNMQSLNVWFYEGVFTYSPNEKWEISPDFRASVKPDKGDFRFGLGAVRKFFINRKEGKFDGQMVHQLKYQLDIDTNGNIRHGVRYVFTYNHIVSEKFIVSGLIGPFYRWGGEFNGIEFIRGGPAFTYAFNRQHTIAFAPLFGAGNIKPDGWVYTFTPMITLLIRINKDYKYVPAKYINF